MSAGEAGGADAAQRAWLPVEGLGPADIAGPTRARVGDQVIVIVKTPQGFRGMERGCPHQKATLTDGVLMTNGTMIRCPKHNFIFRLSDGKGINCVGLKLAVYDVREVDGRLEAALA